MPGYADGSVCTQWLVLPQSVPGARMRAQALIAV